MTNKQKWLLLFGSGWVDWVDVQNGDARDFYQKIRADMVLEFDPLLNRIRLKPNEIIRV
jgi:hypothetical protein